MYKYFYYLSEGFHHNEYKELCNSKTSAPIIQDDFIYYLDINEKSFFKINLSNYIREKIVELDKDLLQFNLYKYYIFYSDQYLYRINIKTKIR